MGSRNIQWQQKQQEECLCNIDKQHCCSARHIHLMSPQSTETTLALASQTTGRPT